MPIPTFDTGTGYLPPGLHSATDSEIQSRLGSLNAQRQKLFGHLQRLVAAARSVNAERLLVDGSFVTDKERLQDEPPNDIDCALWLSPNIGQLVKEANADAMFIFGMNATNKLGPVDLHLTLSQESWEGWVNFFGTDREEIPKGCVEVIL